jgi:zinc transporter ZupT
MSEIVLNSLILFLTALGGGGLVILLGRHLIKHLGLLLTFGGAYLIGLIFLHLAPELFGSASVTAGWFVIVGFVFQVLLEYMSQGIEHGHFHEHKDQHGHRSFPTMIFISLCLHAFIEAMPLAGGAHDHGHAHTHVHLDANPLLIGLIIHKFPVAMVLAGMLAAGGLNKAKQWIYVAIFGLMPVMGIFLGDVIIHTIPEHTELFLTASGGILIGILLHISTTILFESSDGHRFNLLKLMVVVIGIAIAALTLL